jgi:VanZ like family
MGQWVYSFAGMAVVYAGITTAVIFAVAQGMGRQPGWRLAPLVFTTLIFVFLTQHPFPPLGGADCPVPSAAPQLQPFHFMATFIRLAEQGVGLAGWLGNRTVAATVMNFVLCAVIGGLLAARTEKLRMAIIFGVVLSGTVELTQLTGLWGLYPCAYRQFNVDDLILNTLGVTAGFLLMRQCFRGVGHGR